MITNVIFALIGCAHLARQDIHQPMTTSLCLDPVLREMRDDFECAGVARDDISENIIALWCVDPHRKRRAGNDTIYVISTMYIPALKDELFCADTNFYTYKAYRSQLE